MQIALKKSNCNGTMRFVYDDRESLENIFRKFETTLFELSQRASTNQLLIVGLSAGGSLLAFAANRIPSTYSLEIHTLAAPLNGYGLDRFGNLLIDQYAPPEIYPLQSFFRQIGLGLQPYAKPQSHVQVFHHKEGASARHLAAHCGRFEAYCDPLKIQANNVPSAKEFYYQGDLDVPGIFQTILYCH